MALSGLLHGGYSLFLQRAYRAGDFSLVYPIARGTGPLLSSLVAIAFLGERPSPLAFTGGLTIIASIFWLTGGFDMIRRRLPFAGVTDASPATTNLLPAIGYGLGTGAFIAAYTVADRQGVTFGGVSPLLLD